MSELKGIDIDSLQDIEFEGHLVGWVPGKLLFIDENRVLGKYTILSMIDNEILTACDVRLPKKEKEPETELMTHEDVFKLQLDGCLFKNQITSHVTTEWKTQNTLNSEGVYQYITRTEFNTNGLTGKWNDMVKCAPNAILNECLNGDKPNVPCDDTLDREIVEC